MPVMWKSWYSADVSGAYSDLVPLFMIFLSSNKMHWSLQSLGLFLGNVSFVGNVDGVIALFSDLKGFPNYIEIFFERGSFKWICAVYRSADLNPAVS